jgi:hypothetical protein
MSARTIRRASERAALKQQRNQLQTAVDLDQQNFEEAKARLEEHISQARLDANQANAQKSTGPSSSAGKAASSRNALKHALTGQTVLLPTDNHISYQTRLDSYTDVYKPATFEERRLVQAIHDANWRLDRIIRMEFTIYAKGATELAGACQDVPEDQRTHFIELEVAQRYDRDLRNLHTQEARIQRQRTKTIAELATLQIGRRESEIVAAKMAARKAPASTSDKPNSETNGFVFSNAENAFESNPIQPAPTVARALEAA